MDKYFSMDNLGSNVTTTTVWLDYVKPYRKDKVNRFLDSLHQKLWEADLEETYPDMLFSWRNEHMQDTEVSVNHGMQANGRQQIIICQLSPTTARLPTSSTQ